MKHRIEKAKNRIIGQRFGRLLVTGYIPSARKPNRIVARAVCKCDCGNSKIIDVKSLRSIFTQSCGCLAAEKAKKRMTIHSMSNTKEHRIWRDMISRCTSKSCKNYKNYGARGIAVCASWLDEEYGFLNFFRDMGKRPSDKYSIDRINNDGNYEPSNCRWATLTEQNKNKRSNCLITIEGKTLTRTEWSKLYGIRADTIAYRIRQGWDLSKAVRFPVGNCKRDINGKYVKEYNV